MFQRLVNLPKNHSFFLFGARGTGKSTWLKHLFKPETALWINLLAPEEEEQFARKPGLLKEIVLKLPSHITHVVIDEVQKIPKLLDVVHDLIESGQCSQHFVLTGSSARKLKAGAANLLAGRAFVYHLFPLSFLEVGKEFSLNEALHWGLLPKIFSYTEEQNREKADYLRTYSSSYLKEEVWGEQIIRKLEPFRRFIEVAAQSNGKIINASNIARDVGVDHKTVISYFSILEDTLVGFLLEPFQHSFRKRLGQTPKFYFFDTGVSRALARTVATTLVPRTNAYGDAFEHFVILECYKLVQTYYPDYRLSFIGTKDGGEVDLVVDRPGLPRLLIEIKSSGNVDSVDLGTLRGFAKDLPDSIPLCFCNELRARLSDGVEIFPWAEGISKFFGKP